MNCVVDSTLLTVLSPYVNNTHFVEYVHTKIDLTFIILDARLKTKEDDTNFRVRRADSETILYSRQSVQKPQRLNCRKDEPVSL